MIHASCSEMKRPGTIIGECGLGRAVRFAEGRLMDSAGSQLATATGTARVRPRV